MEDDVRAFLTGVAIGGMSIVMFDANKFVLKKLWGANCIAAKMAWEMIKGVAERADDEGCLKLKGKVKLNLEVIDSESEP